MPTLTFGGIGSGIDTEAIISGLLAASRGPIDRIRQQQNTANSAVSSVSEIGSLLSRLETSVRELDTVEKVGSFTGSSTNADAVAISASGSARAGSFVVDVTSLATAYKAYANNIQVATASEAVGQSGTLTLEVNGNSAEIEIDAGDSLSAIVSKINASGLRVSASTVFDGSFFHLQLQGLDTGADNDILISELGVDFGFGDDTRSNGTDAVFSVDGFSATNASNQVTGVIEGATLALGEEGAGPVTVTIESDPDALKTKLQGFIEAYNAVVNKVHTTTGFGSTRASNSQLSGDSTLRAVTSRLSNVLNTTFGSGGIRTLADIGVQLNNDGTLRLDTADYEEAIAQDASAVTRILAGDDDSLSGIADLLGAITEDLLSSTGAIQTRKEGLQSRSSALSDRLLVEQARLDRLEEQLRRQFTEMDQVVSANQAQLNFLLQGGF